MRVIVDFRKEVDEGQRGGGGGGCVGWGVFVAREKHPGGLGGGN
jgi:hypothetical protein